MGSLGLAPGKVSLTPGFIAEQMDRAVFHSFDAFFLQISWGQFHWLWERPHPHLLQFLLCHFSPWLLPFSLCGSLTLSSLEDLIGSSLSRSYK